MSQRYELEWVFVVPGLPFNGETPFTKGLGGSESACVYVARELARLGQRVTVFSNTDKPGRYDGVDYRPFDIWQDYCRYNRHDVLVIQRAPELFTASYQSKLNWLWCHDLALKRNENVFKGALWNVDRVLLLSDYMVRQYEDTYGIDERCIMRTRNGIDLERIEDARHAVNQRDRKLLVYAARPERGLDVLLTRVMPALLERDPEYRLVIAGYDNPVPHLRDFYAACQRAAAALGDRVNWIGALSQPDLWKLYSAAGVYVYPTPSPVNEKFREISCISAMEAQACGLPIVASKLGALPETIHEEAGILIDGDPERDGYINDFVDAVLSLQDEKRWGEASIAGIRHASQLDWAGVAEQWLDDAHEQLTEVRGSASARVRDFIRHSDIVAARALLPHVEDEAERKELAAYLDEHYGFMAEPDGYRKHYEKIGATHDPNVYGQAVQEPRFGLMVDWLRERPECRLVIDYGCAHGAYAIGAAERLPDRAIIGVDIDKLSIEMANKEAVNRGVHERCRFVTGTHQSDIGVTGADCAVIQEVLEHVPEPWAVVDGVERWLRKGAKVLITVPQGPWEYPSYERYPYRAHIWHFDMKDIRDMFGRKKGFKAHVMPFGKVEELDAPIGWYVIEYEVDGTPTGRIDMERKLNLQRPRQTVSATIIAGPNSEETLHWCLRSIRHVADEIIIADCGMSDEAIRIARQYPTVRIIKGVDPKEEGFETPRNIALKHARMDWVLWIDTDEKLVDFGHVHKYLRENVWHGYCLRQHHFACDTQFSADMPVRLFRRRPYNGKTMRFWGMIHEHPELELNEGPGPVIVISDAHIAHVGYLTENVRRKRFARNYPLLQKDQEKYPDRLLQKHFIMRDEILLCQYELARNGGVVTEEIKRRCRRVIDLWRKHFRGQGKYFGVDSLQYYSQALQILGEGIDVAWQIAADKTNAKPNGTMNYRFANEEDFLAELEKRARDAIAPYTAEHW